MTTKLTPERVQELRRPSHGVCDHVEPHDFEVYAHSPLTWGELREFLDAYGKTCEWWEIAEGEATRSKCGYDSLMYPLPSFCPNCGGKVVTR